MALLTYKFSHMSNFFFRSFHQAVFKTWHRLEDRFIDPMLSSFSGGEMVTSSFVKKYDIS